MNRILLAIVALASITLATPAMAEGTQSNLPAVCKSLDMSTMTPDQVDGAKALCASSEPDSVQVAGQSVTPDKVRAWGSLGKEFSTAIVDTARGLGVAANDFLGTPVGMLIAFYFLWPVLGGILIGIPLLILIWYFYLRVGYELQIESKEYEFVPVLWGLFKIKRVKSFTKAVDDGGDLRASWYLVAGIVSLVLSIVIINCLIF